MCYGAIFGVLCVSRSRETDDRRPRPSVLPPSGSYRSYVFSSGGGTAFTPREEWVPFSSEGNRRVVLFLVHLPLMWPHRCPISKMEHASASRTTQNSLPTRSITRCAGEIEGASAHPAGPSQWSDASLSTVEKHRAAAVTAREESLLVALLTKQKERSAEGQLLRSTRATCIKR